VFRRFSSDASGRNTVTGQPGRGVLGLRAGTGDEDAKFGWPSSPISATDAWCGTGWTGS
jgi:hypothetical protein